MQICKKRNLKMRIETALGSSDPNAKLATLSAAYPTNFNLVYRHESTADVRKERNKKKKRGKER